MVDVASRPRRLVSVSADAGIIVSGALTNSAQTAGVRIGGSFISTWTTYLDLLATGTQPLLHHPKLELLADGSAQFSGELSAMTTDAYAINARSPSDASFAYISAGSFDFYDATPAKQADVHLDSAQDRLILYGANGVSVSGDDLKIGSYQAVRAVYSATEPTSPVEGMLWVS